MTQLELIDLIKENNNGEVKGTVEDIVELLDDIRNDADKFTLDLEIELDKFAEDNEVCSICGNELIFKESYDQEEYQGSPVGTKYCQTHGYID
jgi:hypothetical protein